MPNGYEIKWLGWNNDGKHNKIWGYLRMNDGRYFAFWGRRGKTLRFKQHESLREVDRLSREKSGKKGYCFVKPEDYDHLVSDFIEKLETDCMVAILSEKIM